MLDEYVGYLENINNKFTTQNIYLPIVLSKESITNLDNNICIMQEMIDFNNYIKIVKNKEDKSLAEYLTDVFSEDFREAWVKQIQRLLTDPEFTQVTEDNLIDISFDGFLDTETTNEEDLSLEDLLTDDPYTSAADYLNEIDNIGVVQNELPEKKQVVQNQTDSYLKTVKLLDSLETPLFSFLS